MIFNFRLFPFSEIISEILRREHPEELHALSWYELTDGWYWIDVGNTHLFRYTQAAFNQLHPPRSANGRYVDYYVDRLLADLLEMLPTILEPLPAQLVERLSSFTAWNAWLEDCDTWNATRYPDDDDADDYNQEEVETYRAAGDWWYQRRLDTSYLLAGPCIWLWNDGTAIHLAWDNRDRFINDVPAWEAELGELSFPLRDFLAEVGAFHNALVQVMAIRIEEATTYWSDPRFAHDLINLRKEQQQQSEKLDAILHTAHERNTTNWQHVLTSIATIENDPLFITIHNQRKSM